MSRITTFLKGLVRRIKRYMKEFSIGLTMTFIAAAFALLLESLHTSNYITMVALDVAAIIAFVAAVWLWNYTVKQIRQKEAEEKSDRDRLTTAITDLVGEIRKDRAERDKGKTGNG